MQRFFYFLLAVLTCLATASHAHAAVYSPGYQHDEMVTGGAQVRPVASARVLKPKLPGDFGKLSPVNGSAGNPTTLTLVWGESTDAKSYEYCYDTTDDTTCAAWTSAGNGTSVLLSGLNNATTYYWQVRAINNHGVVYADGAQTAFWRFVTQPAPQPPGGFSKTSPISGASALPKNLTLAWNSSSGADNYEYCYDTSNDNACTGWTSTGSTTNVTLSDLAYATTYYWQVRASNAYGFTYANGSETAFWSFTIQAAPQPPGAFDKVNPTSGSANQPTSLSLDWDTSTGADEYAYCVDTTDDNSCSNWTGTGLTTNAALSGLSYATTYYWQVRASSANGTTYANGSADAFWHFTTQAAPQPPGAFDKIMPANGTGGLPTALNLDWETSPGAESYEYCYDTTDDNACTGWISTGAASSAALSGLSHATTYYWQVRARNAQGDIYANGSDTAFWSFTTLPAPQPPAEFSKVSPENGSADQPLSLVLEWEDSSRADNYQYCIYDAAVETSCTGWENAGTATSASLSGLSYATTYHWQVRAHNSDGTTYADGAEVSYWSFTTLPAPQQPPGPFNRISPANGSDNQPFSVLIEWSSSAGADRYEVCYDTTDDGACASWTSAGAATSARLDALNCYTTYYWHVRAVNAGGATYAAEGDAPFWSFTTAMWKSFLPIIAK